MSNLAKGWRTIALGFLMAVGPVGLSYLLSIDWTQYVSPNEALFIAGVLTVLARVITNTPVGTK